jgi:hypothetical protein
MLQEIAMSSAFVREGGGAPQVWSSRDSAESSAAIYRSMDGDKWDYEVRARSRGGFMVARLTKSGEFDSFVEE